VCESFAIFLRDVCGPQVGGRGVCSSDSYSGLQFFLGPSSEGLRRVDISDGRRC
jgi:hypothetical protein